MCVLFSLELGHIRRSGIARPIVTFWGQTIFDYTTYNFLLIPFLLSSLIWFHCASTFFASLSIKDRKLRSIGGAISPPLLREKRQSVLMNPTCSIYFWLQPTLRSLVESQKVIFMSSPKSSIFSTLNCFLNYSPSENRHLIFPVDVVCSFW